LKNLAGGVDIKFFESKSRFDDPLMSHIYRIFVCIGVLFFFNSISTLEISDLQICCLCIEVHYFKKLGAIKSTSFLFAARKVVLYFGYFGGFSVESKGFSITLWREENCSSKLICLKEQANMSA
jgi:hypothetical protein